MMVVVESMMDIILYYNNLELLYNFLIKMSYIEFFNFFKLKASLEK